MHIRCTALNSILLKLINILQKYSQLVFEFCCCYVVQIVLDSNLEQLICPSLVS